jgi:hypothetical protein
VVLHVVVRVDLGQACVTCVMSSLRTAVYFGDDGDAPPLMCPLCVHDTDVVTWRRDFTDGIGACKAAWDAADGDSDAAWVAAAATACIALHVESRHVPVDGDGARTWMRFLDVLTTALSALHPQPWIQDIATQACVLARS